MTSCGRIDDQVDGVGQPLPGVLIQTQIGFALVTGDDLQMLSGQFLEGPQQVRIAAVEGVVQPPPGVLRRPWPAPGRSACRRPVEMLEPLQHQISAQKAGRPGQQHRADLRIGARQRPARG